MIVKSIRADAEGVGIFEDLSFELDRIEFNGYTGVSKAVITRFPRNNIMTQLDRRYHVGRVRIKGAMIVPPGDKEQQIDFFISPNNSGGRPWKVSIIGDKGEEQDFIESAKFDCRFMLPPTTFINQNGPLGNRFTQKCRVITNGENEKQQQQTQQINRLQTREGRDIIQ